MTLLSRIKKANHIGVATIGWLAGLTVAALLLPPDFGISHCSPLIAITLALLAIWTLYTVIALPVYYYRSWSRLPKVPNKTAYALWLGFETLVGIAVLTLVIYGVSR